MRSIIIWFFALLLFTSIYGLSFDIDISSNIAREIENLRKINKEIIDRERIIHELEKEKDSLIISIEILNNKIMINKKQIEIINNKLDEIRVNIEQLDQEKEQYLKKLKQLRECINKRMLNIYKYGKHNIFESFIFSSDINEVLSFVMYNKYILNYENRLFQEFYEYMHKLESREHELKKEHASRKAVLELKNDTLSELNMDIKNKNIIIDRISNDIIQHGRYLDEIEATSAEINKFIMELEAINQDQLAEVGENNAEPVHYPKYTEENNSSSAHAVSDDDVSGNGDGKTDEDQDYQVRQAESISEISGEPGTDSETGHVVEKDGAMPEEISTEENTAKNDLDLDMQAKLERMRELQTQDFQKMKGKLKWPVSGRIMLRYGKIYNNRFNTYYFHNGIDIEADTGSPVKCVYYGQVVFRGWYKGYGNLIIIDHKKGYYTLYAHLEKIIVEKGDMVAENDIIGISGDTGSLKGPILYFEIRRYKKTYNPTEWLSRR